jgi:hypothetical protein
MAETVKSLRVTVTIKGTIAGADGAILQVDETYDQVFNDGTGSDQMGLAVQDLNRPLNATSEDLNLDGLTDFQGAASGLNNLGLMYFRNLDEDTGDGLTIGGASANQFVNWVGDATDKIKVGPKGIFLLVSPVDKYAITASTGDLLKVETDDNSTYRYIIGGDNA